jgi:hypothetical protein
MPQRAFVRIAGANQVSTNNQLEIDCGVDYVDVTAGTGSGALVVVFVVADATVKEIQNAVVAAVLAQQPSGFSLARKDLILQSLDQG